MKASSYKGKTPASSWLRPLHMKDSVDCDVDPSVPEAVLTLEDEDNQPGDELAMDLEHSEHGELSERSETESADETQAEGNEIIAAIASSLQESLAVSGDTILSALKAMHLRLQGIKTPAALASALITFGKGKNMYLID